MTNKKSIECTYKISFFGHFSIVCPRFPSDELRERLGIDDIILVLQQNRLQRYGMGMCCERKITHTHTPQTHTHTTHTHTQPFNGLWSGTTRVGRYQKKYTPTQPILIIGHPLSSSSIYNDPWHPLCSVYVLDSPLRQPLSRSSLVFLLVLDSLLHTPCISSPSFRSTCPYHHSLFCCNIDAMSSIPSLSLSSLLGNLSCSLTSHIHLTILISAR